MLQHDTTQLFNKFAPTIDSVAARLKVPAEFVWRILVRQAYVDFATNAVVIGILWYVIRYWGYPALDRMLHLQKDQDPESLDVFWLVISTILCVPFLFYVFFLIHSIGAVINPEYYALNKILSIARPTQ